MGVFIEITCDQQRITTRLSQQITSLCPVDIFETQNGKLVVKPDQVDECTLCELCLGAAPAGSLEIYKKYNQKTLVSRGNQSSD